MKNLQIKKFIIPIILILIFIIIYFIVMPIIKSKKASDKASEDIFKNFENGLTNLEIAYQKTELDAEEFGAKKAYSYVANEKIVMLYIYKKNSKIYKQGEENGFITSSKTPESSLYGIFMNNCVLLIEEDFPNSEQVLSLFSSLSEAYSDKI